MMAQMQTPQVKVNEHISWGLGIGIQHSAHGESLWHWGSNPGSKSIMVVYPAQRIGIVVLCNSSEGSDLIFAIAKRALGGKAYWDW
jgi:CubicO group peptidase (beta-lactamase class C family)